MKSLSTLVALALLCGPLTALAAEPAAAEAASEPAVAEAAADEQAARKVIESLHGVLLGAMKEAAELGFEGRYERILGSLDETFDLPFMARVSIGAMWKELDEAQRSEFVDLSRRLSASNYADNFDGWGGESFQTVSQEPAARKTIVVKTKLVRPTDEDVKFDYRLRKLTEGWRIIDVQLDGKVSEMTLRRTDYRSVIKRKGYPELVDALEKKIVRLSKEE